MPQGRLLFDGQKTGWIPLHCFAGVELQWRLQVWKISNYLKRELIEENQQLSERRTVCGEAAII